MAIIGTFGANGSIIRASDGASIPADMGNRDYRKVMALVDAGDTIAPYVAPPVNSKPDDYLAELEARVKKLETT